MMVRDHGFRDGDTHFDSLNGGFIDGLSSSQLENRVACYGVFGPVITLPTRGTLRIPEGSRGPSGRL